MGIAAFETKANAPRPVDCDRPFTSSVALERVKRDTLERADVIQSFGRIQDCQQLQRRFGIETAKSRQSFYAKLIKGIKSVSGAALDEAIAAADAAKEAAERALNN